MISTKGRYALRVLIDLAEQDTTTYVPLKEIAKRQGISEKYLQQIVKILVGKGLLTGISGKGSGYRLTASPEEDVYKRQDVCSISARQHIVPTDRLVYSSIPCELRHTDCHTLRITPHLKSGRHSCVSLRQLWSYSRS